MKVMSDWSVAAMHVKGGLSCAGTMTGVLCVIITGTGLKPELCVGNLDSPHQEV